MSDALATAVSCKEEILFDRYRSRPRQLARWLLESRDTLREKYRKLKVDWKRLTVRVNDVSRSRDNWRQRAEVSEKQVLAMQAEVERLSALIEPEAYSGSKKKAAALPTSLIPPGSSALEPPADLTPAQSPVPIIPPGPPIDPTERVPRQSFSLSTIVYFCGLVFQCSSSMSATQMTLAFFFPEQARQGCIPHPTTGRLWLLRLGYFKLHAPLEQAGDWVWLIDHAVEIGRYRFLGIIGIRLADLPPPGECLKLSDMSTVALLPVEASTQEIVHQQLETVASETGIIPKAILSDEGSDLSGGINRFCLAHPETTRHRDMPHIGARLLKKRLEKDERWNAFIKQRTQTKFQTAQTELAFLVPPRLRSKARYMNLRKITSWAETGLTVLDDPGLVDDSSCHVDRLNEKFGWLREYRAEIALWSSWLALTDRTLDIVRCHGYSTSTVTRVEQTLTETSNTPETDLLKTELIDIVKAESSKLGEGERTPGSTEILESSFGKLKEIEGDQSRSGFTSLILIWAALFGTTTAEVIRDAMTQVPGKLVQKWITKHLGATIQSKRAKLGHALRKMLTGKPEEP